MTLLLVEDADAGYGDARAVSGLSLSVDRGEVVALVGANGAGKSTLLRAIAGAHTLWSGRIVLDGQDVTDVLGYRRARLGIALVPEGRLLFSSLTVRENLLMGASSRRDGHWNLSTVVAAIPLLAPLLGRNASRLSGGQQQAVAIGRALMANPDVLLLDEVSLGLAPIAVDEIYESIAQVRSGGLGIVLVEQDLTRSLRFADRVVCLLEGRKVLEGAVGEVTRQNVTDAYFGHAIAATEDTTREGLER